MTRTFIGFLLVLSLLAIGAGIGLAQKPAASVTPPAAATADSPAAGGGSAAPEAAPAATATAKPADGKTGGRARAGKGSAASATVSKYLSAGKGEKGNRMPGGGAESAKGGFGFGAAMMPGAGGARMMGSMMPGMGSMPGMSSGMMAGAGGMSSTMGGMPGMYGGMGTMGSMPWMAGPEEQRLHAEMQQAQEQEHSLLAPYAAAATEQERAKLKALLAEVLDREFDLQQQMRQRELEPIEARVKRLRELMDKRNQARKTIVEKRLDQLLRDAEGLGWNAFSGPEPAGFGVPAMGSSSPLSAMVVPSMLLGPGPVNLPPTQPRSSGTAYPARAVEAPSLAPGPSTRLSIVDRLHVSPAGAKQAEIRAFKVVNGSASSYVEILSALPAVNEKKVRITADARTNSIVAAGPAEDLRVIEALLLRLDAQKTPKSKPSALPTKTDSSRR